MAKEELINLQRLEDYSADMFRDANVLKRNTLYALNNVVCKGLIVLKCILAGTTNTTALSLSGVSVGDELTDGTAKWKVISVNGYGIGGGTSISNWQANTAYAVGDMVINDNKLYQCITAHTSTSTFDGSKWQLIGDYMLSPCKVGEVGYVSWQYVLLENHLALNGGTVNDFQAIYPELYDFFDDNNLITTVQADYDANHALLLYDSSTDTATMPNFLSKTLWGGSTIEEKEAGLPNIKGEIYGIVSTARATSDTSAWGSGAGSWDIDYSSHLTMETNSSTQKSKAAFTIDASQSNAIYGNSTTVQPPAITLIPQIRYKKDTIEGSVGDFYNDTPIGTVISYMGTTAPREYLACDGTVYNISTYQALADYINDTFGSYNYFGGDGTTTFAVPDLRGEFLRGTGTNSHTNQGSGANVGEHQDGTEHIALNVLTNETQYRIYTKTGDNTSYSQNQDSSIREANVTRNGVNIFTGTTTDGGVRYTSRPTNTSVLYCIKYTVATKPQSLRDWTTDTFYSIGDFVIENNTMYRCIVDHVSTVFDTDLAADKWELVTSGGSGLQDWVATTSYKENNICVYEGQIYKALVDFISGATFENIEILQEYTLSGGETPIPYAKGTDIYIGDIVSYDGNYYEALYDFTCGTEFTMYALEEYVPHPLTKQQVQNLINSFVPSGSGTDPIFYNDSPIGTIIAYMGITAPKDYLACDGTIYNIVDYKELAEYIKTQFGGYNYFGGDGTTTFAVPDLRGEFLRGTGANSHTNQGSGSNVGIHQDSTSIPDFGYGTDNFYVVNAPVTAQARISNFDTSYNVDGSGNTKGITLSASWSQSVDNVRTIRPTNTSVLYCIKYNTSVLSTPENNYSTEEQRIGTWIDGKPLYQKTIYVGNLSNNGSLDITLGLPIDKMINMTGVAFDTGGSGYTFNIPRVRWDLIRDQIGIVYNGNASNQILIVTEGNASTMEAYVTIQYTKTTD